MIAVQRCLEDAGWPAELSSEGQINISIPLDQEQAFNETSALCHMQYPLDEKYTAPWTGEQYGILYDHWVSVTIPCLAEKGYEPNPPPTRQTFIDASLADEPAYSVREGSDEALLDDVATGRWESAKDFWRKVCPEEPLEPVLYGPG
ncbi:hypothetical protein NF556_05685 [Ornithinimicrobium faecis]|uniref:Uncharacterized protein n=1 Tax=Ornithinimicrobium faecis TaxID=2934158 RepID=A0ABY4YXF7_9MICO|nr:hypothetical protein [Ornithinimicrobium sp. HY1793]USQ81135.1 hypothetical protein NF556_05685 [Ornithinimicrobium sp. HY1793]